MSETSGDRSVEQKQVRRRQLLRWGLVGAVAAVGVGVVGYEIVQGSKSPVRLGIAPGSQTLWRYVAQRKEELLTPLGYNVAFTTFPDEASLRSAFVDGRIDIMASLVPTLASLADDGVKAQMFLPIAWLHEGYPFIVPADSSISGLTGLPGRRVATYPLTHPGMAYWLALGLAAANLNLASLNPTQTLSPDLEMIQGRVDAACMGGSQWASLSKSPGYRKLTDLQSTWSVVSGGSRVLLYGGYIARPEFILQQSKFIADFNRINSQALQAYKQAPSAFLQVAASYVSGNGPQMDVADNQAQATYLGYDDVGPDRMAIAPADIADYARLFPLMAKAGYLRTAVPDVASLFYQTPGA